MNSELSNILTVCVLAQAELDSFAGRFRQRLASYLPADY